MAATNAVSDYPKERPMHTFLAEIKLKGDVGIVKQMTMQVIANSIYDAECYCHAFLVMAFGVEGAKDMQVDSVVPYSVEATYE